MCYLRSVFLQKNKDVFDVSEIDVEALSQSFVTKRAKGKVFKRTAPRRRRIKLTMTKMVTKKLRKVENFQTTTIMTTTRKYLLSARTMRRRRRRWILREVKKMTLPPLRPSQSEEEDNLSDSDSDERMKTSAGVLKRTGGVDSN